MNAEPSSDDDDRLVAQYYSGRINTLLHTPVFLRTLLGARVACFIPVSIQYAGRFNRGPSVASPARDCNVVLFRKSTEQEGAKTEDNLQNPV